MAEIVMYATSWCSFCARARQLLEQKGRSWQEIDVSEFPERRSEMRERSGRNTVPQIWIGERHVGGFDELSALDRDGELDALLDSRA
ncbi:MAG: glutaredoxin 3 [Myxococcota bacterium]